MGSQVLQCLQWVSPYWGYLLTRGTFRRSVYTGVFPRRCPRLFLVGTKFDRPFGLLGSVENRASPETWSYGCCDPRHKVWVGMRGLLINLRSSRGFVSGPHRRPSITKRSTPVGGPISKTVSLPFPTPEKFRTKGIMGGLRRVRSDTVYGV